MFSTEQALVLRGPSRPFLTADVMRVSGVPASSAGTAAGPLSVTKGSTSRSVGGMGSRTYNAAAIAQHAHPFVTFLYPLPRELALCLRAQSGFVSALVEGSEALPPRRLGGAGRHRGRPLAFSPGPHRRIAECPTGVPAHGSTRSPASAARRRRPPRIGDRP